MEIEKQTKTALDLLDAVAYKEHPYCNAARILLVVFFVGKFLRHLKRQVRRFLTVPTSRHQDVLHQGHKLNL